MEQRHWFANHNVLNFVYCKEATIATCHDTNFTFIKLLSGYTSFVHINKRLYCKLKHFYSHNHTHTILWYTHSFLLLFPPKLLNVYTTYSLQYYLDCILLQHNNRHETKYVTLTQFYAIQHCYLTIKPPVQITELNVWTHDPISQGLADGGHHNTTKGF